MSIQSKHKGPQHSDNSFDRSEKETGRNNEQAVANSSEAEDDIRDDVSVGEDSSDDDTVENEVWTSSSDE